MKFRRDGCQEFVKTMSFRENKYASFVRTAGSRSCGTFCRATIRPEAALASVDLGRASNLRKVLGQLNGISGLKPGVTLARELQTRKYR